MTPPAQPKKADDMFLISRHELTLFATNGFWEGSERVETLHRVESRPAPSPTSIKEQLSREWVRGYIAGQGDLKETICKFQTTAAAQARNDVLDALARDFKGRYVEDAVAEIRRFPESLRQREQQQEK